MPYFDYHCEKCEAPFEIQCGMNDDRGNVACPSCGGKNVRRVFSSIYLPRKSGGNGDGIPTSSSSPSKCSSCASSNCATCG